MAVQLHALLTRLEQVGILGAAFRVRLSEHGGLVIGLQLEGPLEPPFEVHVDFEPKLHKSDEEMWLGTLSWAVDQVEAIQRRRSYGG